jgi:hypothetical protein
MKKQQVAKKMKSHKSIIESYGPTEYHELVSVAKGIKPSFITSFRNGIPKDEDRKKRIYKLAMAHNLRGVESYSKGHDYN